MRIHLPQVVPFTLWLLVLLPLGAVAQQQPPASGGSDLEGLLVQSVLVSSADQDRLSHLDQLIALFPNNPHIGWAHELVRDIQARQKNYPAALAAAEKLRLYDPSDILNVYTAATYAEAAGDSVFLKEWKEKTEACATLLAELPRPERLDPATWDSRQALAKQIRTQKEYEEATAIGGIRDAKAQLAATEEFLKKHPESTYAPQLQALQLRLTQVLGLSSSDLSAVEKLLAAQPRNIDLLLAVAEGYFKQDREQQKVYQHASTVLALLADTPADAAAESAKRRRDYEARANWLVGRIALDRGDYPVADRSLRSALPVLNDKGTLVAPALFYLGWANDKLGRYDEAMRFYRQCATMRSTFQDQAARNLGILQTERGAR